MLIRNIIAGAAAASFATVPLMAQTGQPLRAGSATLAKPQISGKRLGQRVVQPAPERVSEASSLAGSFPLLFLAAAAAVIVVAVVVVADDSSPN